MSIRLYVEGGGDSKSLRTACRKGFNVFIENAGAAGRMPRIVASGSRENAYDAFKTAHTPGSGNTMLLVDAEGPVAAAHPWDHLAERDGWSRPPRATDNQCHLMVQIMESWFLADRETLKDFYGQRFNVNALPNNPNIEAVSKQDVLNLLAQATRRTQKGSYAKGGDSFEILEKLDADKVSSASPSAKRFLRAILDSNP